MGKQKIDGIALIWKINKIFIEFNETPTDINVRGLEKHILLNYTVTDYKSFVLSTKWMNRVIRKWCFGRRISISVKTVIEKKWPRQSSSDCCSIRKCKYLLFS